MTMCPHGFSGPCLQCDATRSAVRPREAELAALREAPVDLTVEDTGAAPLKVPGQERFAQYLADGCKLIDAYVRAGYGGASRPAARTNASLLAKRPAVAARVEYLRAEIAAAALTRRARVVEELERIAYADPRALMTWDGAAVTLHPSGTLTPEAAAQVAAVRATKDGVQITLHPKVPALAKLAEIYRLAEGAQNQQTVVVIAPEKSTVTEWFASHAPGAPLPPEEDG